MAGSSGVNVKMGVTGVSQFKQGMNQAKQAAKTLDAQLALTEKEFKATGDAEGYMAKKTAELKAKLEAQKSVVDNAQKALDQMARNGVDKSSTAYQKLYQEMLKAKGEMLDTEQQISSVSAAEETTTENTREMTKAMQDVNKSVSFDNITNGLKSITDGIEGVITKAWKMGEALVKNTLGAGSWADELNTEASKWDISPEQLQRMRKTAGIIDTDTETILSAKARLKKARSGEGEGVMDAFSALGIDPAATADAEDLFWKTGESLLALGDEYKQEEYAQKLFGKGWRDLVPLFKTGREEYEETMDSWSVVSEKQLDSLQKMDDQYQKLSGEWETFKNSVLASLADVLTPLMEKLTELMQKFNEYIQSPEGQEMLKKLSETLMGLFEDITNIDPEKVMEGLIGIFNKIKEGLEWIIDNKDTLVGALKVIAAGFGLLKLGNLAMNVVKIADGFKNILGIGAGKAAAGAGSSVAGGAAQSTGVSWLAQQASLFGAAGGGAMLGTVSGLGLLGYAGAKMISANLNDENLNMITGGGTGYDLLDRLTQDQLKLVADYRDLYENASGSEEAMNKREELFRSLEGSGFENTEMAVSWLENIFDEAMRGWDEDGLAEKLDRMTAMAEDLTGDTASRNKATSEMAAAADNMQGLPAAIEAAVRNGVSNIRVYIDGQLVSNSVGSTMANAIAGLVR